MQMNKLTTLYKIIWCTFLFKVRVLHSFGRIQAAADNCASVCFRKVGSQKQGYGNFKKGEDQDFSYMLRGQLFFCK